MQSSPKVYKIEIEKFLAQMFQTDQYGRAVKSLSKIYRTLHADISYPKYIVQFMLNYRKFIKVVINQDS